jgi:hypothetical protein
MSLSQRHNTMLQIQQCLFQFRSTVSDNNDDVENITQITGNSTRNVTVDNNCQISNNANATLPPQLPSNSPIIPQSVCSCTNPQIVLVTSEPIHSIPRPSIVESQYSHEMQVLAHRLLQPSSENAIVSSFSISQRRYEFVITDMRNNLTAFHRDVYNFMNAERYEQIL